MTIRDLLLARADDERAALLAGDRKADVQAVITGLTAPGTWWTRDERGTSYAPVDGSESRV